MPCVPWNSTTCRHHSVGLTFLLAPNDATTRCGNRHLTSPSQKHQQLPSRPLTDESWHGHGDPMLARTWRECFREMDLISAQEHISVDVPVLEVVQTTPEDFFFANMFYVLRVRPRENHPRRRRSMDARHPVDKPTGLIDLQKNTSIHPWMECSWSWQSRSWSDSDPGCEFPKDFLLVPYRSWKHLPVLRLTTRVFKSKKRQFFLREKWKERKKKNEKRKKEK